MEYKFILICAIGRCGSTSLQRIINTIPNSNITGENNGSINNLLTCYENLKETIKFTPKKNNIFLTNEECEKIKQKPCWYNSFDINIVKSNIQNTIISILDNKKYNKILGFKEIRYFNNFHLLNTFIELFPNTKIICMYREDIEKLSISGWWINNSNSKKYLTEYTEQMKKYCIDKNNCYLFTFEKMFILEEIKKLFLFLEESFDEQKYNQIILNKLE
jgi:hypothetical protein